MRRVLAISVLLVIILILGYIPIRLNRSNNIVNIYVSHDQDYSQPILQEFENKTGIKVNAVYDTEASKTVGLVNRLIAEKDNPQADVFWNNEVSRTLQLKNLGVLQSYKSDNFDLIDARYKDNNAYWTGFAARARVLLVNTNLLGETAVPSSLEELTNSKYANHITLADPRFGTTGSHLAALYLAWGKEKFEEYFINLKGTGLDIAQSNGQTRNKVVNREKAVGFTDTDDANDALEKSQEVTMIYPDQENSIGTLIIPNTVMIINGSKHLEHAKKLVNYLISPEVESKLAFAKSAQMPLLPNVERPSNIPNVTEIQALDVNWPEITNTLPEVLKFVEESLLK